MPVDAKVRYIRALEARVTHLEREREAALEEADRMRRRAALATDLLKRAEKQEAEAEERARIAISSAERADQELISAESSAGRAISDCLIREREACAAIADQEHAHSTAVRIRSRGALAQQPGLPVGKTAAREVAQWGTYLEENQ